MTCVFSFVVFFWFLSFFLSFRPSCSLNNKEFNHFIDIASSLAVCFLRFFCFKGVDLSKPLTDGLITELRRALAENLVIFFRDQNITPQQHLDFGKLWGELHIHPAAPHEPGHPPLMIIKTHKNSNRANGEVKIMKEEIHDH